MKKERNLVTMMIRGRASRVEATASAKAVPGALQEQHGAGVVGTEWVEDGRR